MLLKSGKFTVVFLCCFAISLVSLFWCIEQAQVGSLAVDRDHGLPFSIVETNAFVAGLVILVWSCITAIFRLGRQPQIVPTIIETVSVSMVNFFIWRQFSAKHSGHNDPVQTNVLFIDFPFSVVVMDCTSRIPFELRKIGIGLVDGCFKTFCEFYCDRAEQWQLIRIGDMLFSRHGVHLTVSQTPAVISSAGTVVANIIPQNRADREIVKI